MDGQRDPSQRLLYTVSSLEYAEGGDEKELYSEEGGEQTRRAHSAHLALGQGAVGTSGVTSVPRSPGSVQTWRRTCAGSNRTAARPRRSELAGRSGSEAALTCTAHAETVGRVRRGVSSALGFKCVR